MDVIAGSGDTMITWYENDGGAPSLFVEHPIGVCVSPLAIDTARVDDDADEDAVCPLIFRTRSFSAAPAA